MREIRASWKGWLAALGFVLGGTAYGAVNLAPGLPVSQNFDSIDSSDIATLPSGWKVDKLTSVRTAGRYDAAGDQTENGATIAKNGIYNFGSPSASGADRSVGFLSSSSVTKSGNLYVQLVNAGAAAIPSLDVSYTVEKYRNGSNPAGFRIQLFFSPDGVNWTSAGEDFFTGFSPDGNTETFPVAPGETVAVSATLDLSATPLAAGSSLYLAWNYSVATGTTTSYAQALGVDDVFVMVTGSEGFNVYFDQVEGFVVLEGIPETLMALAGGGTEPYAYSWSSTLGGAHYETTNNLLTIRGSAPADYYTATVVATDSSEPPESVTNTIGFTVSGDPDILLDFEEGTLPADYTPVAVGMSGYPWYVMNIARGSDPDDRKFGAVSARFLHQAGSPGTLYNFDALVRPVRKLKFWYGNHGADSGGAFKVQVSSNRSIWTDIGAAHYAPAGTNLAQATIDSIPAGMIHVQFMTTAGESQRVNIDEIGVFFDPPGFAMEFDQPNGFAVEEGTGGSVTATAANGKPPYVYAWTSTLAVAHYTAAANLFSILSTAPAGTYSATVVATDGASPAKSVTNTLAFSVVAPPPKYPIAITPPENGMVTTQPAGEATAGTAVSINAAAATGYQVESITVTAADSSPVEVTGGIFTMPAQGVTVAVTFGALPEGVYSVTFEGEGETKTAYASGTLSLSAKSWDMTEALIGTDANDWKNGLRSARLRGYGVSRMTLLEDLADGLGSVSFGYRRYGTDAQVDWIVECSTNGGAGWIPVGSAFTAPAGDEVQPFSESMNVPGPVRLRIKRATEDGATANKRLNIDDLYITPYEPPDFAVGFDQADGFCVEQGAGGVVTATAENGTVPYGYAWTSTLDAAFCSIDGNQFTILTSAPAGAYSASVTATDSSEPVQTATHSLAFQISSRHPIDLTPPVNGSVDTDPSGSALAGETVTVLAVPAGGYAVDAVSVTGDDSTPVEVADGTFTMPDQPVTVTVTFRVSNEPDILLDFEGSVLPTSYAAAVGEMAGYDWNLINVIRGTLENDRKNGEVSARIRHETATAGTLANAEPFEQAITRIRFWYANFGTDSTVTFKVQVSANGVDWSDVGEEAYSAAGIELAEAEIAAIPPGMTFVRFITTGGTHGERINLEDVGLFLGGEAFLAVTLDKLDGFEVVEGYSETVTATALNGTGPYVFSWSTTMAAGDCAVEGPVFTIHSNAARGNYSATVAVTDSTSASASQTVYFAVVEPPQPEGIADFRFNDPPYLRVTARDSGLVVSDMDLTSGTIETNVTTGTYFPDEPFIEESGGWAADNQAGAKAFFFTITPAEGAAITIEDVSFNAYATAAGPSAFGYDIGGGLATGEVDAPGAVLVVVSQAVAGVVGRTDPIEIKIQGWANGSRETSGTGTFRLDDVVIHGWVSGDVPEPPPIVAITVLAGTGFQFNVPGEFDLLRVEGAGTAALPGGEFDWQVLTSGEGHDYTVSEGTVTILSGAADARMVRIVLTPL